MANTRERIIEILETRRGEVISGQDLARQLGVSRTAVWKAIAQLREQGHEIAAAPNRGYTMSVESRRLSVAGIRACLKLPAFPLHIHRSIDSTNNEAKRLIAVADSPNHIPFGTVIIADTQTAGRGRRGRNFASPAADSVYLSFILKPAERIEHSLLVTIMAAVAVCEALETCMDVPVNPAEEAASGQAGRGPIGKRPGIKWVNDIFLGERKVCGILTEAVSDVESGAIESLILGIGVNINVPESDFPKEIRKIAGSVPLPPGRRRHFAARLIQNIMEGYGALSRGESPVAAYRARSVVLGREITVLRPDGGLPAVAREILADGSLLVEYADGGIETLHAGEISVTL